MLNKALGTLEVETLLKMGVFIRDLHQNIEKLHSEQTNDIHTVYRGKTMTKKEFDSKIKPGGLMSFNNFLSTSEDRKGVYTKIEPICQALEIDRQRCDQAMIPVSFNGLDPLFMYTQLLKEALLEIEDDDVKSIKDLVEYCRLQDDVDECQIRKVENEYRDHTPIWWYTAETFIYPMLNHGLRQMDVDIILKMGFFIRHLHNHITELHCEQKASMPAKFQVFRGQGLSMEDFEKMKNTKGGLMSFNNFLSTSRNRQISFKKFARPAAFNTNSVGILFMMNIDTAICTKSSTPFAEINVDRRDTSILMCFIR
ncbi:unnamed protein product [Rotaria sp. Silwood1]|nr:unnamed protein product [Rotaria sp. Silwood1]